jgi:hypothetical protein
MGRFGATDACKSHTSIGYSTPSFFAIGVVEVFFSTCMTIIMFKRNCFPSISSANFVNYFLPIYLSIVVPLVIFCFLIGADSIIGITPTSDFVLLTKWFILRFFAESLSLFFLHPGIGLGSVRRSLFFGALWSLFHLLLVYLVHELAGYKALLLCAAMLTTELFLYYLALLTLPAQLLPRRPAIKSYAVGNLALLIYQLACILAYLLSDESTGADCAALICYSLSEFLQICCILYAFGQDSKFWQG